MARNIQRKLDSYKQIENEIAKTEKRLAKLKESRSTRPVYYSASKGPVFIKDMHDAHIINALKLQYGDIISEYIDTDFINLIGELYSRGHTGSELIDYLLGDVKFSG